MKRLLVILGLLAHSAAFAQPLQPQSDDEVIERLPPIAARRAPPAPQELPERARELVQHARRTGDPRLAGQALALLKPWRSDDRAAAPIVIAMAEAEQHLHDFDAARRRLQALVARDPAQAQAWLMLATLHRVQGRYAESDTACRALEAAGA
ncbi:tetratricopeptide repeat protein, partial [Piscinibacter sp.]|uniref:tetratricopeptide repeat protein n=1 Tax=Piscinibacter sp. TaxID=1903157 RepID=UPI002BA46781